MNVISWGSLFVLVIGVGVATGHKPASKEESYYKTKVLSMTDCLDRNLSKQNKRSNMDATYQFCWEQASK